MDNLMPALTLDNVIICRSSCPEVFYEKRFLEILQNSHENEKLLIKKEAPIQAFSCEFCEIFKNTFFL